MEAFSDGGSFFYHQTADVADADQLARLAPGERQVDGPPGVCPGRGFSGKIENVPCGQVKDASPFTWPKRVLIPGEGSARLVFNNPRLKEVLLFA